MTDTSTKSAAPAAPVRVRIDKSLPHSTVHGDRPEGDAHHGISYFQDGLPFDGEGYMLPDRIDPKAKNFDKLKALAERKQKRAEKMAASKAAAADGDEDEEETTVDLSAWLRGEAKYDWNDVTQRIAAIYKKRVNSKKDGVEFLVLSEKIVPESEVCAELAKLSD